MFKMLHKKNINDMETSLNEYFQEPMKDFKSRRGLQSIKISNNDDTKTELKTGTEDTHQLTLVDVYAHLQQHIKKPLTEVDFRNEIVTLMLTGSETTKVTVSSCLLALAVHQDIQDKLYAEVSREMDDSNEENVAVENLKNMPYLDQVFKETLRWFTVVPGITRTAEQDVKLKALTVPAGSKVGIALAGVHRDPRFYPDPDRFDPDNFLPERVAARPKYAFVPFSGGPRGCVGKHYSAMTVKTFLVHVLRKFKISSDVDISKLNNMPGLAFSYVEGYKIKFHHR